MAQAWRMFNEALGNDKAIEEHALREIQKLYPIKRSCRDRQLGFDEIKHVRQEQSVPILWAASLIVHYGMRDNFAEEFIASTILSSDLDKAYAATTILCRRNSEYARAVILKKMQDKSLSKQEKNLFEEKLQGFNINEE